MFVVEGCGLPVPRVTFCPVTLPLAKVWALVKPVTIGHTENSTCTKPNSVSALPEAQMNVTVMQDQQGTACLGHVHVTWLSAVVFPVNEASTHARAA